MDLFHRVMSKKAGLGRFIEANRAECGCLFAAERKDDAVCFGRHQGSILELIRVCLIVEQI
jgi:hypothetical protein